MIQSTLVLYGFFELINGERKTTPRRSNPSAVTYHTHYDTAIQCFDDSAFPAEFRIFSPPSSPVVAFGTVAFINSCAFVPRGADTVLLEGVRLAPIPGNPNDSNYQKQAPDLPVTMAYGVGVVKGNDPPVCVDGEKSFTVEITDLIRDISHTSLIRCVMPAKSARWANVPLPSIDSTIFFDGVCDGLGTDNVLRFKLDHFLFSLNVPTSRATTTTAPKTQDRPFKAIPKHAAPTASTSIPSDAQASPASSATAQSVSPLPLAELEEDTPHSTRSGKRRAL